MAFYGVDMDEKDSADKKVKLDSTMIPNIPARLDFSPSSYEPLPYAGQSLSYCPTNPQDVDSLTTPSYAPTMPSYAPTMPAIVVFSSDDQCGDDSEGGQNTTLEMEFKQAKDRLAAWTGYVYNTSVLSNWAYDTGDHTDFIAYMQEDAQAREEWISDDSPCDSSILPFLQANPHLHRVFYDLMYWPEDVGPWRHFVVSVFPDEKTGCNAAWNFMSINEETRATAFRCYKCKLAVLWHERDVASRRCMTRVDVGAGCLQVYVVCGEACKRVPAFL